MAPVGYLDTSVIYCDDNLHRLAQFPAESVDLIYLDPPFFSNRHYEVIWGDEAEVRSFEDRWEGGIHVYVEWMRERMLEIQRILKLTGSVYLHCDWHASHYLKVMMDEVFGRENFRNDIIWCYRKWSVSAGQFVRNHDNLLFYTKGSAHTFNPLYVAVSEGTTRRWKGQKQQAYFEEGVRKARSVEAEKSRTPMPDWWDVSILNPNAAERLGYPTQKPLALMERVIRASSNPGDIVLDPFCGCGTTLVAAQTLGRQWIGIDISPTAVELEKRRLGKIGATDIKLVGMPVTEEQLHALKPFEFQNWVIQRMNGTHSPRKSGDMGIDGFSFMLHEPVQVKQSEAIGRNVVDNFETAIKRHYDVGGDKRQKDKRTKKGYIVAFSFGKGAYEEVARVKGADELLIELLTIADLLEGNADLVTPETGLFGSDVPIPEPRAHDARPSIAELVASDTGEELGQVAEEQEPYD